MSQTSSATPFAVSRALNAAEMIEMSCASSDPLRRAQILGDAQSQLAWALAAAVAECADAKVSWADIGRAVGMPRETVFRQFKAGGPIVTVKAVHSEKSSIREPEAAADEGIYAFQGDDGVWHGPFDALPEGKFATAFLNFRPADSVGSPFAGQLLRVRVGSFPEDLSVHAAQVRFADNTERRVRVTNEVINVLFEDGQTPLRRALYALYLATAGNPKVSSGFQAVVINAADAMTKSTPELVAAVDAIIDAAPAATPLDIHTVVALRKLEGVVKGFKAWAKAADSSTSD